jgi:hypothetical protein
MNADLNESMRSSELKNLLETAVEKQTPHASALLEILPLLSQKSRAALLYTCSRSLRVKYWEAFLVAHQKHILDIEVEYEGNVSPVSYHVRGGVEHFASIVNYYSSIMTDM